MSVLKTYEIEKEYLAPWASFSAYSQGREREESPCSIRTDYQRDRDRIIHSKSFRRLMHKTQVFISPEKDHYRTRLTHTVEVMQISRTIARALDLNEDLTEAIAFAHDVGHTPYGHIGESALNGLLSAGFSHNHQSIRMVTKIEKDGMGLNLTREVLNGIVTHTGDREPQTLEGMVVRIADRIAYINHDIEDAMVANLLKESDLPRESVEVLGIGKSGRISTIVHDLINNSSGKPLVACTPHIWTHLMILRNYLFENLYFGCEQSREKIKITRMIESLFTYFYDNPTEMSSVFVRMIEAGESKEIAVADFIAGMTDRFARRVYDEIFLPRGWQI